MQNKGYTLIEILCVLVIGLICLSVFFDAFLTYRHTARIHFALAETQENLRFAVQQLRHGIQFSGFSGCARLDDLNIKKVGVSAYNSLSANNFTRVCSGADGHWSPALPDDLHIYPRKNTDVLVVHYLDQESASLLRSFNGGDRVVVSELSSLKKNKDAMLVDCLHGVEFSIRHVSVNRGIQTLYLPRRVQDDFPIGSEVGQLKTEIFYIKDTGRSNQEGDDIYGLYLKNESKSSTELIEGIINMRITPLALDAHRVLFSISPEQIKEGKRVVALNIELLACSNSAPLIAPKAYFFGGKKIKPSDRRLYRSIRFFSLLPNRV
ncbi:MAG: prepilin-type N-terminal cleavage/methylation domain-containing protein [Pseudomonadota bacterium]|nr:prepilin-type N-terminal cleavage/methylation domain-containing protein [Gammaproteobacteria bacterium]MBU1558944.1 prepilin-type N-terminal cleavage/methylation domain-containing protein [Gammaproteobacteria bacterium]MBU1629152.1 prepilin-type N-terminal cleavage/methylation domain-containing protein [Gammaproteobacteria bacterium]MBU1927160.1 prepilin-type N-terminal cleavage/methylation domain-containing protein [Gammaproteobacteria bacterium]MBU2546228.1 prepilin-type N-terminal cleavag